MGNKLPFMPFYGFDFYADEAVQLMTYEEQGVFLRLLWHQWVHGSIPVQLEAIGRLANSEISPSIVERFPVVGDRRKNAKLERLRRKHKRIQEVRAVAGRKGGLSKAASKGAGKGLANAKESEAEPEAEVTTTPHSPSPRAPNGARTGRSTWLSPFMDPWKAKYGEPPRMLPRVVAEVRDANPAEWAAGKVAESFANFIEETEPRFVNEKTPRKWQATWKAFTNDGEHYRRQLEGSDLMRGL